MEKQTLNQGLNKDLCIDIAEESDRILSTTTSSLNMLIQPKVQKLLTFITIYATIIVNMATAIITVYSAHSALLSRTPPFALEQILLILIMAAAFMASATCILYYAQHLFKSYSKEMSEEVKPFTEALKSVGHMYTELFKYYNQLITSCYQELCEGKSVDDVEISIICAKLDNLRKLNPDKLGSPFKD